MSLLPTMRASQTWQIEGGEDFLQLLEPKGTVAAWVDSNGVFYGMRGGSSVIPATKTLYVDKNRTDSYTPTGSISQPFLTIMAAVNQIAANGDNSTVGYLVNVAPGTYAETVDLSAPALVNLTFVGYGASISFASGNTDIIRVVGNDNLTDVKFVGFKLSTLGAGGITLSSTTNGTNFLSGNLYGAGFWLKDCVLSINSGAFAVTNAGGVFIDSCGNITCDMTINNVNLVKVWTSVINTSTNGWMVNTNGGNPAPAGFSQSLLYLYFNSHSDNITIGAGSNTNLYWNRLFGTVTFNGTGVARSSAISTVVVNSGGSYSERGSNHTTLTVNAGGTYSSTTDVTGMGALTLSSAAPTTPAGVVGLGNGVAASATAGAQTLPANPAGFLVINIGGTAQKIPYYNN